MRGKLSIYLLVLQVIFIILYGFFVQYDEVAGAKGNHTNDQDEKQFNILYPMFQDVHVMIFVGFGFLMTFLKRYGFGSVGFNLLIAAFVLQWAILMRGSLATVEGKIPIDLDKIMNADFAAATVLISFGAVLGVFSPMQLMIMALLEVAVFAVNEWVLFEHLKLAMTFISIIPNAPHLEHSSKFNSKLSTTQISDIGGSLTIHTFGAYFGLAVSLMNWRKSVADHPKEGSVYHSDIFAMIGTLFLWLYWPSFNGALAAGTPIAQRAVTNTLYSIAASAITGFALSSVIDKQNKTSMVHVQNSTLAGGVAAGAVANLLIGPMGAMLVGSCAGIISVAGYKYVTPTLCRAFKIHDTCGVHNLHGMPGVLSAFIAVVIARLTTTSSFSSEELRQIYPGLSDSSNTLYNNYQHQANMQMAGLAVTLGMAIVGGLITGLVLRAPFIDKTKDEDLFEDEKLWILNDDDRQSQPSLEENAMPLAPSNGRVVEE